MGSKPNETPSTIVTQLRPSAELRRPDRLGNLRHIVIITDMDRPIGELDVDDILQINWSGVFTAVKDAICRVKNEGDLSKETVRDTRDLIALALKRLEYENAECEKRLMDCQPMTAWWEYALLLFPGSYGKQLRTSLVLRHNALKKSRAFAIIRERIFDLRKEMGDAVTDAIGLHMWNTDEAYRTLTETYTALVGKLDYCKEIIRELEWWDKIARRQKQNPLEQKQIQKHCNSYHQFLNRMTSVTLLYSTETDVNPSELLAFARRVHSENAVKEALLDTSLRGLCEDKKCRLYTDADTGDP
jgi:hypothetical protein